MKKNDTIIFEKPIYIQGYAASGGTKEGQGPLAQHFDYIAAENRFGEDTWEKGEIKMISGTYAMALQKAGISPSEIGCALGGDLLNQCVSTSFALKDSSIPFLGLYGACSTMAESMLIGAALLEGEIEQTTLCMASSHFCSAERQYRYPLEYGGQRAPSAQWTATAAGSVVLGVKPSKIRIKAARIGRIYDPGVKDASNMGSAMAQSAFETLSGYFADMGHEPKDYDLIVTGDLASIGKQIVEELMQQEGIDMGKTYVDCGMMLYSDKQDVHAGASGCGCSAAVLCTYILPQMEAGRLKKVLFCGTGALMSPLSTNQGQSIPGICHLLCLEAE